MTTVAIFAHNTFLRRDTGSAWVTIADVRSMRGPTMNRDIIDCTSHSSPLGYREFKNGLVNPGQITFQINFAPKENSHDITGGLLKYFDDGTEQDYALIFPDGDFVPGTYPANYDDHSKCNFTGLINGFEIGAAVNDVLLADVTIVLSGKPTWVEGPP